MMEDGPVTPALLNKEEQTHRQPQVALRKEEETWRLQSRCLWLQMGDRNTTFFHLQCKAQKGEK